MNHWRDEICATFVDLDCEEWAPEGFFGEVSSFNAKDLQFSLVTSTKQRVVRSPTRIAQTTDEFFLLSLQRAGRGFAEQSGRTAIQQPGDMTLYETCTPYELRFQEDFQQFVVKLPKSALRHRLANVDMMTGRVFSGQTAAVRLAARYLIDFAESHSSLQASAVDLSSNVGMDLIAMAIMSAATGYQDTPLTSKRSTLLQQILYYVRDNLADPELGPTQISSAHGISVRYLNMLFEDQHQSLARTIWQQRLERCADDLKSEGMAAMNITEIAFSWGFNDSSHFSHSFKSRFGCSPREYRNAPNSTRP